MQLSAGVTTSLQDFLLAMVGLSVAAERVTEVIKQWLFPSAGESGNGPSPATVQSVAIFSGIVVAALSMLDPLNITKGAAFAWNKPVFWLSWLVTGVLVSGGSAFWNHLLDILQAAKVQKEQAVYGTSPAPAPAPVPQPAPEVLPQPA
jgi:hypothetical protein